MSLENPVTQVRRGQNERPFETLRQENIFHNIMEVRRLSISELK